MYVNVVSLWRREVLQWWTPSSILDSPVVQICKKLRPEDYDGDDGRGVCHLMFTQRNAPLPGDDVCDLYKPRVVTKCFYKCRRYYLGKFGHESLLNCILPPKLSKFSESVELLRMKKSIRMSLNRRLLDCLDIWKGGKRHAGDLWSSDNAVNGSEYLKYSTLTLVLF